MRTFIGATMVLAASAFVAGPAQAGLVSYSEAVSGDLSNGNPLSNFVLDTGGVNTISGNIGASGSCPIVGAAIDCDSFSLNVLSGLEIVGISVVRQATGVALLQWRLATGLLDFAGTFIDTLTDNDAVPGAALPLGAGSYNISWEIYPNIPTAGTNYTFTITTRALGTATVPEPTTLALVALAVAGLGLSRRRRA